MEKDKNNISLFISRFLYRIRYQLIFGSLFVTALVAYFTQFMPNFYTVQATIYTGIVSSASLDKGDGNFNFQTVNNSFANLLSLLRAQSASDNIALHLFARCMINGDENKDNTFITAKHFQELQRTVPDEIKALINKKSEEETVANLRKYKKNGKNSYLYRLLNGGSPYFSYNALNKVELKRVGNSDMINISYTNNDPGITTNTVQLFTSQLRTSYDDLRFRSTNDVIKYFEGEVAKLKKALNGKEDELTNYNIANNIINYEEQTKSIASSYSSYEDRYEATRREYESAVSLLKEIEKQMDTRTKLFYTNKDFLKTLDDISNTNGKITELELFTSEAAQKGDKTLDAYRNQLRESEKKISDLSTSMDLYKYSKEGISINNMVDEWLRALISYTKTKAEMKVLDERDADFRDKYITLSPVGTEIKRRERDINVTESSYLEMIRALNAAYLRKKNIQLTSSNLDTISEASFPLSPNKSKQLLFILAALIGSLVFIFAYNLLVELLDRTLRDGERTERLTGLKPIGSFFGRGELRMRGFAKQWNRTAASYVCNKLNSELSTNEVSYINLTSIESREGKSFIAKYICEEWERLGITYKYFKAGEDFEVNSDILLATDYTPIISEDEASKYNIILIEFPALQNSAIPNGLISRANANIILLNACRVWKKSDDELLEHFTKLSKDGKEFIILNNSDRYAVEDFTGQLPPYTSTHSFATRMMHMGLTSRKSAVK